MLVFTWRVANMTLESLRFLRKQYFQLLPVAQLQWPDSQVLKQPHVQTWLFHNLFDSEVLNYPPPQRYQLRVLKLLVSKLEAGIEDPDEDELSDDLTCALCSLLAANLPSEVVSAQRKSYVTYSWDLTRQPEGRQEEDPGGCEFSITLLESPSLISSSGTTGLRTWEAALHLATFLATTPKGRRYVGAKRMLELGAGTGLVSVLCAKYLGTASVVATDGDAGVVEGLGTNAFVNELAGGEGPGEGQKMEANVLKWGRTLLGNAILDDEDRAPFDLVLGADVTYDTAVIPALVATLVELRHRSRPESSPLVVLLAATIRNQTTFATFERACAPLARLALYLNLLPCPFSANSAPSWP
ncbi:putative methyltransferase-domain-containing protein [Lineolata rhizophorae]|uniref:Putative methyltransferase-domain-containing protein n=1 Tax=Lineolata rhizophorae TaxID=578093 RepID=A0A6A6NXJ7_9PEZI|nr:putative methyltransferase-domain-containing protein [Lineolata rhizophorae]